MAEREGLPLNELRVGYSATGNFPLTGQTTFAFKVIDNRDGAIYVVTLDENGQELDGAQLRANERAAHIAKYGKLDPRLFERLAIASGDELIEVIIWLKKPPFDPQRLDPEANLTPKQRDDFFKRERERLATHVQAVVAPVVERLVNLGH